MTAKEYLQQLFWIDKEIEEKQKELAELRTKAESVGSQEITGMPKAGNGKDKISAIVVKIVDLQAHINLKIDQLIDWKAVVTRQIEGMKNPKSRVVLSARYLRRKEERKWEQIAKDLNYEESYLLRLHRKALKEFERKYPEIRKIQAGDKRSH